jgi:hypothetical protein
MVEPDEPPSPPLLPWLLRVESLQPQHDIRSAVKSGETWSVVLI